MIFDAFLMSMSASHRLRPVRDSARTDSLRSFNRDFGDSIFSFICTDCIGFPESHKENNEINENSSGVYQIRMVKPWEMKEPTSAVTPEQILFNETYAKLRLFVAHQPGPALRIATVWHLEEVKFMKQQIENMQNESVAP